VERTVRIQDRSSTVDRERAISEAPSLCQQFTYFGRKAIVIVTEIIVSPLLTIGLVTGKTVILGLAPADSLLLVLTLAVSALTFTKNRTNVLMGAVHILLFLAYLMLIFEH